MISNLYFFALLICISDLVLLSYKKDKSVERYHWTILFLIPIIVLGYWFKSKVHTTEAAELAFCFIYLDSTILLVVSFFAILKSMRIKVFPLLKSGIYVITAFHLVTIWMSKDTSLYYKTITLQETGVGIATKVTSGPLKITHYIFLGAVFIAITTALIVGLCKKSTYSKKVLWGYAFFSISGILIYVLEMIFDADFSMLPFLYTAASVVITSNFDTFQTHDIHQLIGERQSRAGQRGFVAFDRKKRLLGFNNQFSKVFPEIEQIVIDTRISDKNKKLADYIYPLLNRCREQGNYSDTNTINGRLYSISVSTFSVNDSNYINGFLLELSDITEEQQRIELIKQYNERLFNDVNEKTDHILDIQNAVVLGLANMIENRDNNTGGHVKRTSDIIRILVKEAIRQDIYSISAEKSADIVRAAPMHDLGKMSIESVILCKPARLSPEEYAIMKTHAPKSGEIVHIILDDVEENHFVETAFNIARYHHERWDGKGYPDGLLGPEIPLEARIMAVADVYDALVSKRCYKEPMSFADAERIMIENMGSQFDPAMRPIFAACKESLERYYTLENS